jgi:hypothetical protein
LSCFYGIVGFLPDRYRVAFSTGSGIAGILMNLIKYVILLVFPGDDEHTAIIASIIFFAFSVFIVVICIFCVFVSVIFNHQLVYKNPYFIYEMRKSGEFSESAYVMVTNEATKLDERINPSVRNLSNYLV